MTVKTVSRGTEMRRELMARCKAWCDRTDTKPTILGMALNDSTFVGRMADGHAIMIDVYDRTMAALDALDVMEDAAGPLAKPSRKGRTDDAYDAKELIRARIEGLARTTGIRAQLIALAVSHESNLMHDRGGLSVNQTDTYHARLDRIQAAFAIRSNGGSTNDQPSTGDNPETAPDRQHAERPGEAVH